MARPIPLFALAFAASPFVLMHFQPASRPSRADTERALQVMALVKGRCASCHGGPNPKAKLDLSTADGIRKGGNSGSLFVPGHPEASLLLERLQGKGEMDQMPLGFAPLTPDEIKLVSDWIASGPLLDVSNKDHWAYQEPVMPPKPSLRLTSWPKNGVDTFVLAKLESEHLHPSPAASREALIRRVTLDLTGLPPTIAEVDAFVNDGSPNAYEKVVDRLLASPHFGERQARIWLDLARYADSDGYEKDLSRTAWKWRDWVIDAYNQNMPFDEFTIEQIAGDQLPNPTIDQLVATGFNRNTMLNLEGGVDQAEAHFNVVVDRVNTTSTVWLGSTMMCSRCHNHKYDPFTQKDYYSMAAFFNNAVINPKGPKSVGEEKWFETFMPVPTAEQSAKQAKLTATVAEAKRKLAQWTPDDDRALEGWRAHLDHQAQWTDFKPASASAKEGGSLAVTEDGSILATGMNPAKNQYVLEGASPLSRVAGLRLESIPTKELSNGGAGRSDNGNFVINSLRVELNGKPIALATAAADFEQDRFPATSVITGDEEGWAISPEFGKPHELVVDFQQAVELGPHDRVKVILDQQSVYERHTLGHFRLALTGDEGATLALAPMDIRTLAKKNDLDSSETAKLRTYFTNHSPRFATLRSTRDKSQRDLDMLNRAIPTAMIMRDKPIKGPLTENIRTRGEFLSKGDLVQAATPSFLPAIKSEKARRLELAKWLVSKQNPLTARVQVNRIWEQYFGRGIVETTDDFGTQSAPPSNPELQDYMAVKFMDSGWDVKALHKMIVMSATYRQSSASTKKLNEIDPQNILLARGPRFRMEAEMIRDNALAVSGLLNPKIGGPSVFPYQPAGMWNNGISGEEWINGKGADLYRRSLYTFWKRTSAYPVFTTFDATSREECTPRRIRTNTPLQALALMNDPGTFAAAQAMGRKMAAEPSPQSAIVDGFRACTARKPTAFETERLEGLEAKLEMKYRGAPDQAKKIARNPKEAAWTMVANTMLNLDETITKQ